MLPVGDEFRPLPVLWLQLQRQWRLLFSLRTFFLGAALYPATTASHHLLLLVLRHLHDDIWLLLFFEPRLRRATSEPDASNYSCGASCSGAHSHRRQSLYNDDQRNDCRGQKRNNNDYIDQNVKYGSRSHHVLPAIVTPVCYEHEEAPGA